ncbi:hypothetical protein M440DRAFT_1246714 [Trichoderma longibrachiatum ATCC 18648]|uniref:Uncharacterized protein n=1 Tax=Trichoderma longibrachiatum ATCC 18648 TaxID=983965 RepID=A0A2T4C3I9_TRILO|nr:hypothetical protein M440DRAFT_1246714 [Trichoderma longibrachiatum ATCC 18648]
MAVRLSDGMISSFATVMPGVCIPRTGSEGRLNLIPGRKKKLPWPRVLNPRPMKSRPLRTVASIYGEKCLGCDASPIQAQHELSAFPPTPCFPPCPLSRAKRANYSIRIANSGPPQSSAASSLLSVLSHGKALRLGWALI